MDVLAALREKVEQGELYTLQSEATLISFEANQMKSASVEETRGQALRVMVDGRLGFAAVSGQVEPQALIASALDSARYGDRVSLAFPGATPGPDVDTYDPQLAEVPLDHFVEIGREIIATLRQVDGDAQINVEIERGVHHSSLRNTAGAATDQRSSSFALSISIERVRDDDVLIAYETCHGVSFDESYRQSVERLAGKMEQAKRPARLQSGHMPVLFSPRGSLVLCLPIMMGINGQNVQRGISPMSDKRGQVLFDEKITLWDDPTLCGRPSSSSHDDEGVPCRRKAVIQRGTCQSFLLDLRTAALLGEESTGNGTRALFSTPSPSASNLVMEAGDRPLADLLAGISHGLLVDSVLGLGQGNPISGAFSNSVGLGFAIENGEIAGRVKDISIAGNTYTDLRHVEALSQEREWVYGHLHLPYVLLPDLNVVGQR